MKQKKSRLDSRLVEAFNQLKDIQQNITQTQKEYQSSKKSMEKVEQNIQQLEQQLTDSKDFYLNMKINYIKPIVIMKS